MATLSTRIQTALNESRLLLLASQVFLGFEFRAPFEPGFEQLPRAAQTLKLASLGMMIGVVALLISVAAWHRIVEHGEDEPTLLTVINVVLGPALGLFALVLGVDFYVGSLHILGSTGAAIAGAVISAIALLGFHGYGYVARPGRRAEVEKEQRMERECGNPDQKGDLKDRIEHVLTEMRVATPGAQALLGFQFSLFLMESFEKLPVSMKRVHLVSVACTTLTIILLLVPPAYHRIAERGEQTEHFHRLASIFLVVALIPLSVGLGLDTFVVVFQGSHDRPVAVVSGLLTFILCVSLWFGVTFTARLRRERQPSRERQPQVP